MNQTASELSRLFGLYRAEWLNAELFKLFTEPTYLSELRATNRPCVLIGGRGTGKTTVLRGLSYEGQLALARDRAPAIHEWPSYAIYLRVNTNRFTAFLGSELDSAPWERLFAHYLNLLFCSKLIEFLAWYSLNTGTYIALPPLALGRIATSLHLPTPASIAELGDSLSDALVQVEAAVNNVADGIPFKLSVQGAPLDLLTASIAATPAFAGKSFAFLIDEYENFLDYQQRVVNTLIKNAEGPYTFKIAVRELGWRTRATLNANEHLVSPADYHRIHIDEQFRQDGSFSQFAQAVCQDRLTRALGKNAPYVSMPTALPGFSDEEEALALGVEEQLTACRRELALLSPRSQSIAAAAEPLRLYFFWRWSQDQKRPLDDILQDSEQNGSEWATRYDNYKHSLLFTIRKGKRGVRKYYAGWNVLCKLSAGNIRYLLELVHQSFLLHLATASDNSQEPSWVVSQLAQTEAAEFVAKKNLTELEGVSSHGGRLTKLLLSLGRVFQVMAANPGEHAPEINQFELSPESPVDTSVALSKEVDDLLRAAIMHLALVRDPGNKLANEADTRDYLYMIHPIFAAFFVYSYRRKRKMRLNQAELIGLVRAPAETIRRVLARSGREDDMPLPDQLLLFQGFYDGSG